MSSYLRQSYSHNNKQPYNHDSKLPNGGFGVFRFSAHLRLFGSVLRSGNKQIGIFRCSTPGQGTGGTQHIASLASEYDATYCVMRSQRTSVVLEDPELTFFGSQEECRRICADNAILMIYFELNCIIAYLALITEILCIIINERTRLIFPM